MSAPPPPPRPGSVTASPALSLSLQKGPGLKQWRGMTTATRYEKTATIYLAGRTKPAALASGLLGTLAIDADAAPRNWPQFLGAGPVLRRTMSSAGTTVSVSGTGAPSIRSRSRRSARVPISVKSVRTVVSGGSRWAASGMSS
jgi:hypothetical protein